MINDSLRNYIESVENGKTVKMGTVTAQWQKVNRLKVGAGIAVVEGTERGSNPITQGGDQGLDPLSRNIFFDEIVSIKKVGREKVFDIEVEGTHNFAAGHYINLKTGKALTQEEEKALLNYKSQTTNNKQITNSNNQNDSRCSASRRITRMTGGQDGAASISRHSGEDPAQPETNPESVLNLENLNIGNCLEFDHEDIVFGGILAHNTYISGNVGIGTTSPAYALDVKASGTGVIARFNSDNSTGCTLADGGTISCSSDVNLKKNVTNLSYGINEIMNLRPVAYNWRTEAEGTPLSFGFIAQEVEPLLPKLVITGEDGLKQLNTIGLVPVLTKAFQELNAKFTKLESTQASFDDRLQELGTQNTKIETEILNLESRIWNLEERQASTSAEISNFKFQISNLTNTLNQLTSSDSTAFQTPVDISQTNVGIGSVETEGLTPLAAADLGITSVKDLVNKSHETYETNETNGAGTAKTVEDFSVGNLPETTAVTEEYESADPTLEAGDVVSLNEANETYKTYGSDGRGEEKVLGVVTGSNLVSHESHETNKTHVSVVLLGKTTVKIAAGSAPIKAGDFLRASSVPGHAEKATGAGLVIGRALENWPHETHESHETNETYVINVLVNVSWYDPALAAKDRNETYETNKTDVEKLVVTGSASLADLTVAGNVLVAANLNITDVGLSTVTGDLEIQKLGRGKVKFFDDKIVFTPEGNVTVKGTIKADKVLANEVKAGVVLAGKVRVATESAELRGSNPITQGGDQGLDPVNHGSYESHETYKAYDASTAAEASSSAQPKTDATIGSGEIEAGHSSVFIANDQVTANSKIFVTATTPTGGQSLIVSNKVPFDPAQPKAGFTVEIEVPIDSRIRFDYWIIN